MAGSATQSAPARGAITEQEAHEIAVTPYHLRLPMVLADVTKTLCS